MVRMTLGEVEAGLKSLYDDTVREPVPALFADVLERLGEVEPGAMGGKAPGSVPFAGGELARA